MFADDTNITIAADSPTHSELEDKMNVDLEHLNRWLTANRLSLNVARTEFMVIGSWQRIHVLGNDQVNVEINGKPIERIHEAKSLGL